MVFGPSSRIESRSDSSKPRMSEVIPTIDVMPMTTPSTVSADRILFVRSVSIDMPDDFAEQTRIGGPPRLLPPQRLDRVEARRTHCRKHPEEQADAGGDADPDRHRPHLDRGGSGDNLLMISARMKPRRIPTTPPNVDSVTDSVRICQTMSRRACAERLAEPDLPGPLSDDHQHDVHDHDAADDEREGHDPDEHRKDPVSRVW